MSWQIIILTLKKIKPKTKRRLACEYCDVFIANVLLGVLYPDVGDIYCLSNVSSDDALDGILKRILLMQ